MSMTECHKGRESYHYVRASVQHDTRLSAQTVWVAVSGGTKTNPKTV